MMYRVIDFKTSARDVRKFASYMAVNIEDILFFTKELVDIKTTPDGEKKYVFVRNHLEYVIPETNVRMCY